ncbi:putrescine aminotransferase [Actinokineospora alba]|uniref:Putrescine aminotransferase n=1 Tax=Actinokineospora alba TaxID=504798 RepID=A0A1H0HFQ2_9PSEU|nr:aspartate aminotransferase family protein [Actinokineospora alba]TDP64903.1 putrescine aminotransferase [Actinokineospora alba]SDH48838.1 putrescine aminotransferase [Actinokineospora alba]SDO17988.1 putrescine aminotransferase [Actinokineospora alba]
MSTAADRAVFQTVARHFTRATAFSGKLAGQGAVEHSADGATVTLSDGRTMLDFGSYAVTLLGHRHPAVVAAVRAQLDAMPVSSRSLVNPVTAAAAERLVGYFDGLLPRLYFGLNGADVVEAAVKLARLVTGRPRVLAVEGAYHGKSLGALALTHHPRFRAGLDAVLPAVTHLSADDPDAVAREVAAGDVAALIFEPVQGENGVRALPEDTLRAWCGQARAAGVTVIADEIQCGLRRCGPRSVALDLGLPVDALLVGKPLGGGVMPISALLCTDELYGPLIEDPARHTATFSGQPLCAAAVPAALDAIESLADHAESVGERLGAGLRRVAAARPGVVAEVRGRGLLWALDFTGDAVAGEVLVELTRREVIVSPCLSAPTSLRLLPPMVATAQEVDHVLATVEEALAAADFACRANPAEVTG